MKGFLAAVLLLLSSAVPAQPPVASYPPRAVRVVVPFAPGGPSDLVARPLGQRLGERLGQQFVVENRPGAGGNVGVASAAKAAPDGLTLLVTSTSLAVNATLTVGGTPASFAACRPRWRSGRRSCARPARRPSSRG